METMETTSFWHKLDLLVVSCTIRIDRPAGSAHPRYPSFIYPLDYGFLEGTQSGDGGGLDVWIGSLKRECLNHFFCFSLRQLDHIVQTYGLCHNRFRPHQALGNRPVGASEDPSPQVAEVDGESIRCQRWLGGLLNHYYRRAA